MSRSKSSGYSSNTCSNSYSTKYNDVVEEPRKKTINGVNRFDSITPKRWERAGSGGVQIKEADVGQPCTECSECKEGFEPHDWRKTCKNCKCSRDGHEVIAEHGARSRLGFLGHDGLDARTLGYTFVPPGLTTARQVDQYYSTLPSDEVPKLGSKGETIRSQRIVKQLPKQDLSLSACKFVEQEYATSYEDFVSGRNQVALDVGVAKPAPPNSICANCDRPVSAQQIVVAAPRLGNSIWHPGCFKCTECDDLLVDLAYCTYEDSIYCERHYAEKMKPRCAGCDETIGIIFIIFLDVLLLSPLLVLFCSHYKVRRTRLTDSEVDQLGTRHCSSFNRCFLSIPESTKRI